MLRGQAELGKIGVAFPACHELVGAADEPYPAA